MSHDWYCKIDGHEFGPMPLDELVGRLRGEQLSLNDPVREGAGGQWVPAASVAALRHGLGLRATDAGQNGPTIGQDPLSEIEFVESLDAPASASMPDAPVHEQVPSSVGGEAAPSIESQQRPKLLTRIFSWQKLIVVGLIAAIAVGYWSFGQARQAAYQAAYDDLEQLYQRLRAAQNADYDPEQWNDFKVELHTRGTQIRARVQTAPKGSAGNYLAAAATLLETLAEIARREDDFPDEAKISRSAVEGRFLVHMKLARQQLRKRDRSNY